MNSKKYILLALCVAIVAAASCKKDDKKTTTLSDSFSGTISFEVPKYVQKGEVYKLDLTSTIKRLSKDESDAPYGIAWTSNVWDRPDTVRLEGGTASLEQCSKEFVVPDTLCTITISVKAFAKGYYNTTASNTCIVIDTDETNGSLQGLQWPEGVASFTDPRDGEVYKYITLGGLDWMARNLAYDGSGHSIQESKVLDAIFGRFYTWDEAQSACPDGWRTPSNEDWMALSRSIDPDSATDPFGSFVGVSGALRPNSLYLNDIHLWDYEPAVNPTNSTYFNLIPAGYAVVAGEEYTQSGMASYAVLWTSDAYDESNGYYRMLYSNNADVKIGYADKSSFAAPLRCVR